MLLLWLEIPSLFEFSETKFQSIFQGKWFSHSVSYQDKKNPLLSHLILLLVFFFLFFVFFLFFLILFLLLHHVNQFQNKLWEVMFKICKSVRTQAFFGMWSISIRVPVTVGFKSGFAPACVWLISSWEKCVIKGSHYGKVVLQVSQEHRISVELAPRL